MIVDMRILLEMLGIMFTAFITVWLDRLNRKEKYKERVYTEITNTVSKIHIKLVDLFHTAGCLTKDPSNLEIRQLLEKRNSDLAWEFTYGALYYPTDLGPLITTVLETSRSFCDNPNDRRLGDLLVTIREGYIDLVRDEVGMWRLSSELKIFLKGEVSPVARVGRRIKEHFSSEKNEL